MKRFAWSRNSSPANETRSGSAPLRRNEVPCPRGAEKGRVDRSVRSARRPGLSQFAAIAPVEIQRHQELGEILDADVEGVRSFFGLAWLRARVARDEEHEAALRAFQRLLQATLFQGKGAKTPENCSNSCILIN